MFTHRGNSNRLIGLALSLLIMTAGMAVAQGPGAAPCATTCATPCVKGAGHGYGGGGMGAGKEMRMERLAERLELTEEQQQTITGIHETYQTRNKALHKDLMRLRNELQGAWLEDDLSEKTIVDLTEKISDTDKQLAVNRAKCHLEMAEQLTPEQRDKMLMMKAKRGGRGGGQRGHGSKGGGRGYNRGAGAPGCTPGR